MILSDLTCMSSTSQITRLCLCVRRQRRGSTTCPCSSTSSSTCSRRSGMSWSTSWTRRRTPRSRPSCPTRPSWRPCSCCGAESSSTSTGTSATATGRRPPSSCTHGRFVAGLHERLVVGQLTKSPLESDTHTHARTHVRTHARTHTHTYIYI